MWSIPCQPHRGGRAALRKVQKAFDLLLAVEQFMNSRLALQFGIG